MRIIVDIDAALHQRLQRCGNAKGMDAGEYAFDLLARILDAGEASRRFPAVNANAPPPPEPDPPADETDNPFDETTADQVCELLVNRLHELDPDRSARTASVHELRQLPESPIQRLALARLLLSLRSG
jgi:hypothetical protein